MAAHHTCKNCGSSKTKTFYEVRDVPAHSVLLMRTREAARSFPKGDIRLAVCEECGFIFNTLFDPTLQDYSTEYESTQSFSETFNAFARETATRLIEKYHLRGKTVLEIGCGNGEFLSLLCRLGNNRGIGFDPAFVDGTLPPDVQQQITVIKDYYSPEYTSHRADLICCKMTLEHIPEVSEFVATIRATLNANDKPVVFFQIPATERILREGAFWDIYYEHCSYFTREAARVLFEQHGFHILHLESVYAGQYLIIESVPRDANERSDQFASRRPEDTLRLVDAFSHEVAQHVAGWREKIDRLHKNGARIAIWGGGSKAVAFLSTLGLDEEIYTVVDINPRKQGTFLPGTGHKIVSPQALPEQPPDVVVVMNGVYSREIQRQLQEMHLHPELLVLN